MSDAPLPPAGWYPDPYGGTGTRYWDGAAWTEQVQPAAPAAPAAPAYGAAYPAYGAGVVVPQGPSRQTGLWVGGLVCGLVSLLFCPILFGPAGITLGAVAVKKGDKLGWIAVGVSIVCMIGGFLIGIAVFSSMRDSGQI